MRRKTSPKGKGKGKGSTLRVLYVEDEKLDVKLALNELKKSRIPAVADCVHTPEDFAAQLAKGCHDIILADVKLPGWSGMDALETLKQKGIDIPFILVTGSVGEEAAVEYIRMGATDYVLKDRLTRLPAAVRRAIEEKALRAERDRALEQTRRLAAIVESSSDAIVSTSREGFITSWNKGAEALYGYSAGEVLGKPLTLLTPSERKGETASLLERLAQGEVIHYFETQRARKDGSLVDVSINAFPIVDSMGRVTGNAGTHRNTTENKRAEGELRFKTALLEAQSETTIDGILVVDSTDHIALSNRQFSEMMNIPADLIRKKDDKEVLERFAAQVKDPDAFIERVNYLYAHETEKSRDEIEFKDGRVFDRYSSPLHDPKGKYYGRIWYFRDVTERKQAEEAMRQSEKRLLLASEAADAGLWDWDISTGQIYVSPHYFTMMGYAVGELPSTYETWLQLLHPDDRDRMMFTVQKYIEEKNNNYEVEFRLRAKTGEWRWILGRGRVIASDSEGRPTRMTGAHVDITEHKRAAEALRENEALLNNVGQIAKIGGWEMDLITRKARWTRGTYNIVEIEPGDPIPGPDEHVGYYLPEYRSLVAEAMRALIEEDKPLDFEARLRTAKGNVKWCRAIGEAIREGNKCVRIHGTLQDTTDRKRAEEELRLTQFSVEHASDSVFWMDPEGRIVYVNEAACRSLGCSREEVCSLSIPEIDPHFSPGVWKAAWEKVKAQGTVTFETHHRTKEGKLLPVEVTSNYLEFGGKEYSFAFARDITERKQAEEALRMRQAKLESIFLGAPVGIGELVNRVFTLVNHRLCEMLGYSAEELIGMATRRLYLSEEEYERTGAAIYPEAQERQTAAAEVQWRRKDGGIIDAIVTVTPIDRTDPSAGAILTVMDRTQHKRMEEEKAKLEAQFLQSQKLESIGRLAGGVAHDFNNLLTVINGYSDLLLRKVHRDDPIRPGLSEIQKAGSRAAALTQQLLTFSRKQVNQPQPLDLNAVISDQEQMLRRVIGEDIALAIAADPAIKPVLADSGQIHQVIMNLVVNARDAMPDGGTLAIKTANADLDENYAAQHQEVTPGHYVLLAVSDTGVGMTEEVKAHLFEPFYTTKAIGAGTGLGLSTVFGIVKQAGGHIAVESEVNRGTTIRVYFPLTEVSLAGGETVTTPVHVALRGSETVLLAEDQDDVRKLTVKVLRNYGYQVLETGQGIDALRLAERHSGPIHLLLTDLVMPGVNGRELAERMKLLRPETKVLYMSGYPDDVIAHQDVSGSGVAFIQKPFTPDALAAKLRSLLDVAATATARILVADDEEGVRNVLRDVLTAEGYTVLEAANGKEVQNQMHNAPVDMVITDLVMPEREGLETIQGLRHEYPKVKIIAISGAFGGAFLKMAAELGAQATLAKPITPEKLLATVRSILRF